MLSAPADSLRLKSYKLDEVVVTGTRNETDIRHLPMTISVVGRQQLEQTYQPSILPTLTEQVPGLFTTSRGIMGYGVSTGAAGGMSLRGIGAGVNAAGGPTTSLLVLIDGHPQYMGLMGHPIADAYQSMMAERVEVLRGPASVLYGSNAMGGVINIVTRKMQELEYSPDFTAEEFEKMGVGAMRKAAREGDEQNGSFMCGQIAGMVKKEQPAKEIIEEMFSQAEALLKGASQWVK